MIHLETTGLKLCLISHMFFPLFLTGLKKWTHVLSPVTIFANFLWFNLGHVFSNWVAVCSWTRIESSINICGIHMAEIFRTFIIRFKMKYTLQSGMPAALAMSRIEYLQSLSIISGIFETFASHFTVTVRSDFDASLKAAISFFTCELSHKIPF